MFILSKLRDQTQVSCIAGSSSPAEPTWKPIYFLYIVPSPWILCKQVASPYTSHKKLIKVFWRLSVFVDETKLTECILLGVLWRRRDRQGSWEERWGDAYREIPGEYLKHRWDLWLIQGVLGGENISGLRFLQSEATRPPDMRILLTDWASLITRMGQFLEEISRYFHIM